MTDIVEQIKFIIVGNGKNIVQSNGVFFSKENEAAAYSYMWQMSVSENVEYSAEIFLSGVFVRKGVDEYSSQPINSIPGESFGENYFKIDNRKMSLIAHIHTHQSKNPSMAGVRGFSTYGGDDYNIAHGNG